MVPAKKFVCKLYLTILFSLFLFIFILPGSTYGEGPLLLDSTKQQYNLNPYLEILEDKEHRWTIDDVSSPEFNDLFYPNERSRTPGFSYTQSAYWLRFRIKDIFPHNHWFLEIGYPILDRVEVYFPDGSGGYSIKKTGDLLPFHSRELYLPDFWGEETTVYIRTWSDCALIVPMTVWGTERFMAKSEREYLIMGVYFGIILIMLLYNLFLYIYVRSLNYLYYVFYIVNMGFFHFTFLTGLLFSISGLIHPGGGTMPLIFLCFLLVFPLFFLPATYFR
ncbi:MAG: hypothetical protein CVU88_03480 [Firmicutes bacterium HGW-Firmicutes-13]|nr:MAG: hypothetical protein CVU88_03480 [Firmicutes bacterium HGW-Firmicutes-13]